MSWTKRIYEVFKHEEPSSLIGKLDTTLEFYECDELFIMTTVNSEVQENAYVASPYALIINYSKDELYKIESKLQRSFFTLLIKLFGFWFRSSQIDKVQSLNNSMLSTNFFSQEWEHLNLKALEQKATERHPQHTLLLRSVNPYQNPKLFTKLLEQGWVAVVTRQVYLFKNQESWAKKRDTKKDKKLLNSERFYFVKIEDANDCDLEQVKAFYDSIYLDKHSQHNIHYQVKFFRKMIESKLYVLYILKDREKACDVGVIALTNDGQTATVPLLGYDIDYPQKDALYRRLMHFGIRYAFEHNVCLNISSGASSFKLNRGAEPELEYMFVKVKHLAFRRRIVWQLLGYLSKKFYAPMLKRLKL